VTVRDIHSARSLQPETPDQLPPLDPNAQARTHTREEAGDKQSLSLLPWMQRAASGIMTGESLAHRNPPSIAQVWERHVASARHYPAGIIRGPRYLWGVIHTPLYALLFLLSWITSSPPLLVLSAVSLYLIHLFA